MADVDVASGVTGAGPMEETLEATIKRLAGLPELEFESVRLEEAKHLGIRASMLDKFVKSARSTDEDDDLGLSDPELWPEEVDGDDLLDRIAQAIRQYVVMPPHTDTAAALWVAHTYCFDLFQQTPRLAVQSPEKGCGKSTLLDVIECLSRRALKAEGVSGAAVYRVIEEYQPTLIIDEIDTVIPNNEELRGVLNSGHRKNGRVLRCVGDDHRPTTFKTFAPLATGGIGRLPATLEDRAIPIVLQKRKPDERIERFLSSRVKHLDDLASQIARWISDHQTDLRDHEPALPNGMDNRPADNWIPLFTIADVAGGEWPERARFAAGALQNDDEAESAQMKLLADIRSIFAKSDLDRIFSTELCEQLALMDDRPWPEWGRSRKPITPPQVARLLNKFKIKPSSIRVSGTDRNAKGYKLESFKETFSRYITPIPPNQSVTTSQVNVEAAYSPIPKRHNDEDVTFRKPLKAPTDKGCDVVTAKNGSTGQNTCIHCYQSVENDTDVVPAEGNGWLHSGCYDQYFGFRRE